MSDEEKQAYIDDYKMHEGVTLDPTKIEKNPGKYSLAKLYLNSLWGKFGQRLSEDFTKTVILHNTNEGVRKLNTLRAKRPDSIKDFTILSPNSLMLTIKGEALGTNTRCASKSVVLAIFTTAYARLKLYTELLMPLGRRICYYDTDSAIFVCKNSEMDWLKQNVPLGKYLGDITNELGSNKYEYGDEYIVEYVSGGPKNYGYITNKQKSIAKVKGHNLHQRATQKLLNYETIKKTVLYDMETLISYSQIKRKAGFLITTDEVMKVYRLAFMKRKITGRLYEGFDAKEPKCIETRPFTNEDLSVKLPTGKYMKSSFIQKVRKRKQNAISDPESQSQLDAKRPRRAGRTVIYLASIDPDQTCFTHGILNSMDELIYSDQLLIIIEPGANQNVLQMERLYREQVDNMNIALDLSSKLPEQRCDDALFTFLWPVRHYTSLTIYAPSHLMMALSCPSIMERFFSKNTLIFY